MLGWSLIDLAKASGLSVVSVRRAEDDRVSPATERASKLIKVALETKGVRFLPDDGSGPGLRVGTS